MNKSWLGYLSSFLMLLAGVLMILGQKVAIGCAFIVLSVVGLVIRANINKKGKQG